MQLRANRTRGCPTRSGQATRDVQASLARPSCSHYARACTLRSRLSFCILPHRMFLTEHCQWQCQCHGQLCQWWPALQGGHCTRVQPDDFGHRVGVMWLRCAPYANHGPAVSNIDGARRYNSASMRQLLRLTLLLCLLACAWVQTPTPRTHHFRGNNIYDTVGYIDCRWYAPRS